MKKNITRLFFIIYLTIFSLFSAHIGLSQQEDRKDEPSTTLKIFVVQKHDKEAVSSSGVIFTLEGKIYEAVTDSRGIARITGIKLSNPVFSKGHLTVSYNNTVIWEKDAVILNIKRNNIRVLINGDVKVPSTPRVNQLYNYTNNRYEPLRGEKDPYSSVYINREEVAKATPSSNWETEYLLKKGLNTLVVRAKNIWGAMSKPLVFHITCFPVKRGEVKVLEFPQNTRVEREAGSSAITWDASEVRNVIGYNVYRSTVSGTSYEKVNSSPVKANSYTDMDAGNEEFFYRVTAVFPDYETAFSEEVSSIVGSLSGTDVPNRIREDTVLTSEKGPYLVSGGVTVDKGVTLTIEPGTDILFKKGQSFVSGRINAQGTPDKPIKFLSSQKNPESGDWLGLKAEDGSRLKNCRIKNAGRDENDAVLVSGKTFIENNQITDNAYNGIGIKAESKTLISGNKISRNKKNGMYSYDSGKKSYADIIGNKISRNASHAIVAGSDSNITGNELQDNGEGNSIKIEGNKITRDVTWDSGVYSVSSLEVAAGVSLSLEPGTVVKAARDAVIRGKIIAEGSDASDGTIVFTSSGDASYGEDVTFENIGSIDEVSGWRGLQLADGSRLKNCSVNYTIGKGVFKIGDDVDVISVETYFIMEAPGLLGLSSLIRRAVGREQDKKKNWFETISAEFILFLVVAVPIAILVIIMVILKNRRQKG
ncbi:MAG: right-handed parallel beta-helix repeat-containing protein [Candidatus Omnitrophica bacterium]|nr:right-handed parallel beta-helix repeat-containing protein [Candidatus Omnitrophota bacterium]